MAGACNCESCLGKAGGRPAGALEAFEAGQTAGLNALKNRWLGRVAARVALERPAEALEGFDKRSEKQNAVTGVATEWNGIGQGRAMAVKKQVPHLWWSQAPPLPSLSRRIYTYTYVYIYAYDILRCSILLRDAGFVSRSLSDVRSVTFTRYFMSGEDADFTNFRGA